MSAGAPAVVPVAAEGRRALVVFCDSEAGGLWWLRLLKPGFRHVFVALEDGAHWITVDPLSPHTDVAVQPVPAGFDLAGWFRRQGMTVVQTRLCRPPARPLPPAPFTCVEAVKRILGLWAPAVLTPWQLHRHLVRAG
ncbi:hypothetical protein [Oleisolibacter albus]|uniref:hypothetical protein n=1 Tax=Oleisolibacter albus TaxID=2171757 RepID=UPI000DF1E85B|nr:hypothetical protein [Oleisolibacter albus]